jgi:hypothetical protein
MESGVEKGRCLLFKGEENEEQILSKYKRTQKWMKNFLNTRLLNTDKEIAYKKITSSAKSVDLENLVRVLHQTKKKWKNKVGK